MAPWHICSNARIRNRQGQKGVARERFGACRLTNVDVWQASKTRRVDQERAFGFPQELSQRIEAGIINLLARNGLVGPLPPEQFLLECLPKISRCAKKDDHGQCPELRRASARTLFR